MRRVVAVLVLAFTMTVFGAVTRAHAAWRTIYGWAQGSVFLACKYTEHGPYGPVWQVRLVLAHQPGQATQHLRATFNVMRVGADGVHRTIASTHLATDGVGQWDVRTATGSQSGGQTADGRWVADRWSAGFSDESGVGAGDANPERFSLIGSC